MLNSLVEYSNKLCVENFLTHPVVATRAITNVTAPSLLHVGSKSPLLAVIPVQTGGVCGLFKLNPVMNPDATFSVDLTQSISAITAFLNAGISISF